MSTSTVLITRSAAANRELAPRLEEAGFTVVSWPGMDFEELPLDVELQKKLQQKYDLCLHESAGRRIFFKKI
jgi:uroporphyrinogen-III synthase